VGEKVANRTGARVLVFDSQDEAVAWLRTGR
jgi:hypothetical protein